MKLRSGFVSNSSSVSFCVWGTEVTEDESDRLYGELYKAGLDCDRTESGVCIIGRSWDTIGDDQTGADFKSEVQLVVEKLLDRECVCDTWEDGYYDG